jgi:hypothetical protein
MSTRLRYGMGYLLVVIGFEEKSRQGKGRQGKARQDKTRHDKTRHDMTRHDKTRQDMTRQDMTRQDKTRQDKTRQNMTRQDKKRQDKQDHVMALRSSSFVFARPDHFPCYFPWVARSCPHFHFPTFPFPFFISLPVSVLSDACVL